MTIDDDMNDMRLDSEESPPPEESGNRSFLIVAAILGGITILSLLCIVGYAMFYLPRSQQQKEAQVATLNAQNTAVAMAITQTSEAAAIPANPTQSAEQKNAFQYKAQEGDTPASIAEKFGVSVDDLMRLNKFSSPDITISPGVTVLIPPGNAQEYQTQTGDTPAALADRFGVDLQDLLRLNKLTDPNAPIPPNTVILIPPPQVGLQEYQAQEGDTAASIAERFGAILQDLLRLNRLTNPNEPIPPGVVILVPTGQIIATPTPLLAVPTDTPVPTVDQRTATVAALLTQAAIAQQTTVPTSTALPTTGFAEDVGIPGLLGMALLLVVVIFLARRLRSA